MDPISIPFVIKQVVRALTLGSRFICVTDSIHGAQVVLARGQSIVRRRSGKGVRAAIAVDLKDEQAIANQSLESSEQQRHES